MLSELSFLIANAASIILNWERGRKEARRKLKILQNRTRLTLAYNLCVWQNRVGSCVIFILRITDMADLHGIRVTDDLCNYYKLTRGPQVILVPCKDSSSKAVAYGREQGCILLLLNYRSCKYKLRWIQFIFNTIYPMKNKQQVDRLNLEHRHFSTRQCWDFPLHIIRNNYIQLFLKPPKHIGIPVSLTNHVWIARGGEHVYLLSHTAGLDAGQK